MHTIPRDHTPPSRGVGADPTDKNAPAIRHRPTHSCRPRTHCTNGAVGAAFMPPAPRIHAARPATHSSMGRAWAPPPVTACPWGSRGRSPLVIQAKLEETGFPLPFRGGG
jgi:hypothetical protein